MPITNLKNHLCTILVETGSEPLEYHCSESADVITGLVSAAVRDGVPLMRFLDKDGHVIFVRARKVLAVETVYSNGG
jgi:hypothetical protein